MLWKMCIKAAFEAGDWEGIGKIVGNGLNTVVTAVDGWITSTFHPAAVIWAGNIAQTLNGTVGGFDWVGLSILIADGLNAVFDTLNTFLTTFDYTALGVGLGVSVTSIFSHIDWNLAGSLVAGGINRVIEGLFGAVTTINWSGIGASLAAGFMSAVNGINWIYAGQTINAGIAGMFQAVNVFMSGIDWASVGRTIGGIVNGLDIVTWLSEFGTLMSSFVQGMCETITSLISEINWQQLGTELWNAIADFLQSFDWSGVVSSAFECLGTAVGAATALISNFVSQAWEAIKAGFEAIKETYFSPYFNEYGQMTIQGFFQGILDMLANIGQWIVENIVTPFLDGFKAAFGIASPSTVMEEQGGYIIAGLLQGITTAWESIVEWVTGAVEAFAGFFSGLWETISGAASTAWEGIKTTITSVWSDLSTSATQTWNSISTTVTTLWNSLSVSASTTWAGIKNSVSTCFSNTWVSLSATCESIKTGLSNTWTSVSATTSTIWESISTTVGAWFGGLWSSITDTASGIQTDLSSAWESVKTTASTAWEGLKTTVVGLWTNLKTTIQGTSWADVGSGITSGVKQGISDGWNTFKTWVSNKFSNLVASVKNSLGIHSPSTVFANIGEYLMMGLNVGVQDGEGKVLKTISTIAGAITDGMSIEPEINAGGKYAAQLDSVADKLSRIAVTFVEIANALDAIGGFKMPAVAAGTVIPYKTRIAAESASTGKSDPFMAFTTDFDETMSDQRDILQRIAERLDRLELKIDGDSLTRAIMRRQRSYERSYG